MQTGRITAGGQLSIPAVIRRRWGTSRVALEDRGDVLVVRPLPEDVLSALRGSLKGQLPVSTDDLRKQARTDEAASSSRKSKR